MCDRLGFVSTRMVANAIYHRSAVLNAVGEYEEESKIQGLSVPLSRPDHCLFRFHFLHLLFVSLCLMPTTLETAK